MTVISLYQLNTATRAEFTEVLGPAYEHSPWVAAQAWPARPFTTLAHLKHAFAAVVRDASSDAQLQLIQAHPELAKKATLRHALTKQSTQEQSQAGLNHCSEEELDRIRQLNGDYKTKFGWPFVLAVRGPRGLGLSRADIINTMARRLQSHAETERAECLRQIHRIAELRLNDIFGVAPLLGNQIWDCAELLARHSESPAPQLTVTYLSPAHQACQIQLKRWMQECGFDTVSQDAVGNVVGLYFGRDRSAKRLLTGSHFDTVRNAGKFDGRLGILVPMVCVRELHRQNRRLPFAIEVVAFSEEEGQRYPAAFLGSSALAGQFDPTWLDLVDAEGISMRQAMQDAGLRPDDVPQIARDPNQYLGFVEVHIEQGPVLEELNMPLGVVTAINASVRYRCEIKGVASHAGTTPMMRRFDAAVAAAELALYVETRAKEQPNLVGTMGMLHVPNGSVNVVPGCCQFSLDLRASSDLARDDLARDVADMLHQICARRELQFHLEVTMRVAAAPSDPLWQLRWERAVQSRGLPIVRLPSGAGHDAMKLQPLMAQAMLFVRGGNGGISHNPLETITSDDAQLAVEAFEHLLNQLADELQ